MKISIEITLSILKIIKYLKKNKTNQSIIIMSKNFINHVLADFQNQESVMNLLPLLLVIKLKKLIAFMMLINNSKKMKTIKLT